MPRPTAFDNELAAQVAAELFRGYSTSDLADRLARSYDVSALRTNRDVSDCLESLLWEAFQLECESSSAAATRVAAARVHPHAFAAGLQRVLTTSVLSQIRADLGRRRQPTARTPERVPTTRARHLDPDTILDAIWEASGRTHRRAILADVKQLLGSPPQEEFAAAILSLQDIGQVVLYREDNTKEAETYDPGATIYVSGQPRHIVWLHSPRR